MTSRRCHFVYLLSASFALLFAGLLLAQNGPRSLIVNGKPEGSVTQVAGRSYIDVETVARITGGSVTLESNRVVLSIPGAAASGSAANGASTSQAPPSTQGLSRSFSSLAIAELAEMREWRGAVGTILTYNVPVVGSWPQDYRDRSDANLRQVALAVSTSDDQNAMQLLENEFSNLTAWANNVVSTRQSLNATNTVRPDTMQNDQALAKITECGRFLGTMLVRGSFADDQSCH